MDLSKKTGIKAEVLQEICELAKKHQIEKVILFGSRARGDYQTKSDIDLAAKGGDVMQFSFDVDEQTSTLLMYDIVDMDGAITKELENVFQKEGIVLYEKI